MKVICINEHPRCSDMNVYLTKGKIYDVEAFEGNIHLDFRQEGNYGLINDVGRVIFVARDAFKTIDEYRNDKIEQLIDDEKY